MLGYDVTDFHAEWLEFQRCAKKSLLLAPRGHGKSTICNITYVLWKLLNNPDLRVMIVSNTLSQATSFLREIKTHIETNSTFLINFGAQKGNKWTEDEIILKHRKRIAKEANITAMGVLGPVISKHYDLIILDDVVDEENARTKTGRKRLKTWFYMTLLPTLEPDGELHLIGTRYNQQDLYGELIAGQGGYKVKVAKAIKSEGNALWPEKFSVEKLFEIKSEAGSAIFNAQYMNDITAMKGSIFKEQWLRFYDVEPPYLKLYQAADLAIGESERHDYFALVTVGKDNNGNIYVLDTYRGRLSFDEQFALIRNRYQRFNSDNTPVMRVGIESVAYQEALAGRLRKNTNIPVKSIRRSKDKITRAHIFSAQLENGKIYFLGDGSQMDLIEELLLFPEAEHDDLFDALETAVSMATGDKIKYSELLGSMEKNIAPV